MTFLSNFYLGLDLKELSASLFQKMSSVIKQSKTTHRQNVYWPLKVLQAVYCLRLVSTYNTEEKKEQCVAVVAILLASNFINLY